MNLHARLIKLNADMLQLQKEVHRVIYIGNTKFAILFFNPRSLSLEIKIVDRFTAQEIIKIEDLNGDELLAYGAFSKAIADWCGADDPDGFPIDIDPDASAEYSALVQSVVSEG